jgi:ABC-type multidrug transport system ATPase subunit
VSELLSNWKIPAFEKIGNLSKGMRAKLLLIASIGRKPRLLLLDEPTEGLDAESTEQVLGLITYFCSSGNRTVVLATHRLEDVERVCDRIAVVDGEAFSGNLDDIKAGWSLEVLEASRRIFKRMAGSSFRFA